MKKRIFNNYVTSIIGFVLIIAAFYFRYIDVKIDYFGFTVGISIGCILLGIKDSVLGIKPKE